ncbi:MAG TPA: DUF4231 domain-containing protein [Terriglobia bacterium]|nr:DUF4231 domain-containing protein [Terriglobia bacterium]
MDEAATKKYLDEDFQAAVDFYDRRATRSKRWYRSMSVYLIVVSATLTPIVALAPQDTNWRVISTILAATIVVATGLLAHLKCHENWLSYRASWDALKRERRLFEAGVAEYVNATDRAAMFVERVEAILAREAAGFYARHAKGEEQAKKPDDVRQ